MARVVQRGAAGVAALALLALPVSLGVMVAHNDAQLSQPAAISRAFADRTTTTKVVPSTVTTALTGNSGLSAVGTTPRQSDADESETNGPIIHHHKKHQPKKHKSDIAQPVTIDLIIVQPATIGSETDQPVTDLTSQLPVQLNPAANGEANQGNGHKHGHKDG